MEDKLLLHTNKYQTPITQSFMAQYPEEVQEQFFEYVSTVPLIKWLIGEERPRAKDLPRDDKGRIIVDLAHPHILEDMDYFRPAARFYEENGCYSLLRPNSNPNSKFGKWLREEIRRCRDGYVRETDGEWVTGTMYFYLNYCPILLNRQVGDMVARVEDLPDFWEGIYWRFHYLDQARRAGKHCMELARRGASKSYTLAAIMAHNLILGENSVTNRRVVTILTAYLKEYLADKDGTLTKFTPMIDYCAQHTEFPRLMLKQSPSEMIWRMGYKNPNGNAIGSLNSVMGLSVKDDEGKIRGKRGVILFEEMGNYVNFKQVWDNVRDSVREGNLVFGLLYAVGTAGDDASDFSGVRTMLYHPDAYEIYAIENVYDKSGKGSTKFPFFFPAYISRALCMDKDGNSDVTKALLEILMKRYDAKLSGDSATYTSSIAQMPITPAEAILKVQSNFFPVVMLNERLKQLDTDLHAYDDVYVGTLIDAGGTVQFRSSDDIPIREYPVDNTIPGALEIYEMPPSGNIPSHRYIVGLDPVDNDQAVSQSLSSCFVFDLFTDRIVAEYTGRRPFADDNFELVWLLCRFYNAMLMYESNKKGCFSFFARKHSLYMLADCPEYLRDKQLIKYSAFGSAQKGITMNGRPLINYADSLIRDWLCKTTPCEVKTETGEIVVQQVPNLYKLRNRALIQELVSYGPAGNFDRVRALDQVMLYREEFLIKYGESIGQQSSVSKDDDDDDFFDADWKRHLSRHK